jgi:hypothetical protein
MRVLSLDASTTTIGISVLEYDESFNIKLIHYNYYKPNSEGLPLKQVDQLRMVIKARDYIIELAKEWKIDEFVIEDYVKFMGGGSTASTIIPLAILNSTLRIGVLEKLGIEPIALNVIKIRHAIKISDKVPSKEEIPETVAKVLGIEFPWIPNEKKKSKKLWSEVSWDIGDAIAVGLAFIKLKNPPIKEKKSKKKKCD